MKIRLKKNFIFVLFCLCLPFFLYGCKDKEGKITAFDSLPESSLLTEIKDSLQNNTPLAIAFTAEWCPHCRNYKPIFSDVKTSYKDKVKFINIDVDDTDGSAISNRFQVRGIPTTAFVRADGSVLKVQVGEIDKENLSKIADDLIKNKKRKKGDPVAPFPLDINKDASANVKQEETSPKEEETQEAPAESTIPEPAIKEEEKENVNEPAQDESFKEDIDPGEVESAEPDTGSK